MRSDRDIDYIDIKTVDGDYRIDSRDEYIYWIKYVRRLNGYRVKTLDHDYVFHKDRVLLIDVSYEEEF